MSTPVGDVQFEQNTIRVPYGKAEEARRKIGMSSRIRFPSEMASQRTSDQQGIRQHALSFPVQPSTRSHKPRP